MEHVNIPELVRTRTEQASFHVASERHVRVEFRNLRVGEKLGPFRYAGDVVITCFRGTFALSDGQETRLAKELDQFVVPENTRIEIECTEAGTAQIIWAPAFAQTEQG